MRNNLSVQRALRAVSVLLLGVFLLGTMMHAQDEKVYDSKEKSQAQKEADRLVSLSAERIISILSDEPGLMILVKKRLVKLAFDQGRVLDESELTDDAIFRLVRDDANMRVIATSEIEKRNYVRAKPTQEEIEKERNRHLMEMQQLGASSAPQQQPQAPPAGVVPSQESQYWSAHDRDNDLVLPPKPAAPAPSNGSGSAPSTRRSRSRDLDMADDENDTENPYDALPSDRSRMAHARVQDLPDMMAAASGMGDNGDDSSGGDSRAKTIAMIRQMQSSDSMAAAAAGSGDVSDRLRSGRSSSLGPSGSLQGPSTRGDRHLEIERPEPIERPDTDLRMRHRANPYADVPALYDLYSQVAKKQPKMERFGAEVFEEGGYLADLPLDAPVGSDYLLGPGDMLNIELWGGVSERRQTVVDREGRIVLPEVGTVLVAGRSLGEAQHEVQTVLKEQFRDVQADLALARLRTVRVYVVGAVNNPGAYDISSLSTPLNALYAAGGPTDHGSLRSVRHMRGNKLIEEYDAYDLILKGMHASAKGFQPGDTIMVPTVGPQVTVEGMVHRPAIYELHGEQNLAEVLELAGGVMSTGTLRHIVVERLQAHEKREMLSLDIPEDNNSDAVNQKLADFKVQDGDKIRIAPIVAYADKSIYLDGHLFHPGKYAWHEGMKVSDIIKSSTDLLPEPYLKHAEIIRLNPQNFAPQVIAFNLGDALAHKDQDLALRPFDTVRIFGRFDFEDTPIVTVSGEVRQPGDHRTNGAMHVTDAVYLAGGLSSDAELDEAQLFRKTPEGKVKVLSVNLGKAMSGDETENLLLQPKDRLVIHKDLARLDPATVTVEGEVGKPGKYPLGEGMTAADAVRAAGGFKRSADTETADLTRYNYQAGAKLPGEDMKLDIAKAMAGDAAADIPLKDGDVLSIRQLTGWQDRGAFITLKGEVAHPGTYGIRPGERLSSVIQRAGGMLPSAYPYGSLFTREQVRQLEEQTRIEMIRRVEEQGDSLRLLPLDANTPNHQLSKNAAIAQWEATLEKIKATPPVGRMVIHITSNTKDWVNTLNDVELRAGDTLTIPKKPSFVMVTGAVYTPNAVSYRPGRSADWYLEQGGGITQMARKKATYIVHADGSIAKLSSGLWTAGLGGTSIRAGDTIVTPEKAIGGPTPWQTIFGAVQSFSSVAIASQYLKNF